MSQPLAEPELPEQSALAAWQAARQRLWLRGALPAIGLAWLLTALIVFQQLLFAIYGYTLRNLSARYWWADLVLQVYPLFTGSVGPLLVLAVEFTIFVALALALWQLSLQRIPAELVVTQLPAKVYAHRLRLARRVYAWWIGLLCIAPQVTQLVLILGGRRLLPSRWRGSPEEELLLGLTAIAALLAASQLAQLLQLRYGGTLGVQWQLLLPGAAYVIVRGAIAAAEVMARDRSSERLSVWDPPFPWHVLGLLALIAALGWGAWKLRQLNSTMPRWYRG
jgi:hypothetical protein